MSRDGSQHTTYSIGVHKSYHSTFRKTAQSYTVRLAYESNYGPAANSMPSDRKNELLASFKVDFGQFCAGPSQESTRSDLQFSGCQTGFRIVIGLCTID